MSKMRTWMLVVCSLKISFASGEITLSSTQNLGNKTVTLSCHNTEDTNILFLRNDELITKCLKSSGECYPRQSEYKFRTDISRNVYNMTIYWVSFDSCETYKCSDSNVSASILLNITVFNTHEVRRSQEPREGRSGKISVTTHCSLPSNSEDYHVEWYAITEEGHELVVVNEQPGTTEMCPFSCNGANASMFTTEIYHNEENVTESRKRIKYQVKIRHISDNFTEPLIWTTNQIYYVDRTNLDILSNLEEERFTCDAPCLGIVAVGVVILLIVAIAVTCVLRKRRQKRTGLLTIEYNDQCEINEACSVDKDTEFDGENLRLSFRHSADVQNDKSSTVVICETKHDSKEADTQPKSAEANNHVKQNSHTHDAPLSDEKANSINESPDMYITPVSETEDETTGDKSNTGENEIELLKLPSTSMDVELSAESKTESDNPFVEVVGLITKEEAEQSTNEIDMVVVSSNLPGTDETPLVQDANTGIDESDNISQLLTSNTGKVINDSNCDEAKDDVEIIVENHLQPVADDENNATADDTHAHESGEVPQFITHVPSTDKLGKHDPERNEETPGVVSLSPRTNDQTTTFPEPDVENTNTNVIKECVVENTMTNVIEECEEQTGNTIELDVVNQERANCADDCSTSLVCVDNEIADDCLDNAREGNSNQGIEMNDQFATTQGGDAKGDDENLSEVQFIEKKEEQHCVSDENYQTNLQDISNETKQSKDANNAVQYIEKPETQSSNLESADDTVDEHSQIEKRNNLT